ncbi:MAG: ABC transporter ATP-binding protein, partial [Mycolicibacterium hassiacum]
AQRSDARRAAAPTAAAAKGESAAARQRRTAKELARIENQLTKLEERIAAQHEAMAAAASDHVKLAELNDELQQLLSRKNELEEAWLALAED